MKHRYLVLLCCALLSAAPAGAQTKEEQAALDLEHAGRTDEAIAAFNAILKSNPANAPVLNEVALLYNDKAQYETAYRLSGEALKLESGNIVYTVTRAKAAIHLWKSDEVLSLMETVIARDPSEAVAYVLRGQAYEQKEQMQLAIGAYSKAITADPSMLYAVRLRGTAFNYIGRYEDALRDLNLFFEKGGKSSEASNQRGMAQYKLGNKLAAIEDFTKAVEAAPGNYSAFTNRGNAYMDAGQPALAEADFDKALALSDNYADANYGMARFFYAKKEFAKAAAFAERAMQGDASMNPYRALYAQSLIGLGREREVPAIADKMLAQNAAASDAYLLKATAYSNLKEFDKSLTTLNAGIGKLPDNYMLYSMRAAVYRFQHNDAAAAADDATARRLSTK